MNQYSKLGKREHDYELTLCRDGQDLLRFYGTEPQLLALDKVWRNDLRGFETIKAAVVMGLTTDLGAF